MPGVSLLRTRFTSILLNCLLLHAISRNLATFLYSPQFRILKCCPLRHIWSNACNFSVSGKLIHNKQAVSTKLDNSTTAAHLSLEVDQNKSINKSINSRLFPIFENYPSSKKLSWNITVNSLLRLLPLRNFLCHQNYLVIIPTAPHTNLCLEQKLKLNLIFFSLIER